MKTLKQHIAEGYKQGKYGAGNVGTPDKARADEEEGVDLSANNQQKRGYLVELCVEEDTQN